MLWHEQNIPAVWVRPLHHLISKVGTLPPILEIRLELPVISGVCVISVSNDGQIPEASWSDVM